MRKSVHSASDPRIANTVPLPGQVGVSRAAPVLRSVARCHPRVILKSLVARIMVQELRYVQNLGLGQESVFTLILSGQAELRAELRMKDLEAVSQRVTVRCHLAPLGLEDTTAYIRHGLKGCSVERTVFTDPAIALIHAKSRGLMRRVGSLATQALLDAALDGRDLVEEANVERAFMDSED